MVVNWLNPKCGLRVECDVNNFFPALMQYLLEISAGKDFTSFLLETL